MITVCSKAFVLVRSRLSGKCTNTIEKAGNAGLEELVREQTEENNILAAS